MATEIEECRLASEKRWSEVQIELQKLRDVDFQLNDRLEKQEIIVKDIQELSTSVSILANNMKSMLKELQLQNNRLQKLEQKPAKRWDMVVDKIVLLAIGAIIAFISAKMGIA